MQEEPQGKISINTENDIVDVRKAVRTAAVNLGFGSTDVTRIATAASELARNIFRYAGSGVVYWRALDTGNGSGIELTFEDTGPGIADIEQAMQEGYTTGGGLGLGLPGAKRLMDEIEIQSEINKGTVVTIRKWKRRS